MCTSKVKDLRDIIESFEFTKGDYGGAEKQLLIFAENYVKLSLKEANLLRDIYDVKDRLRWFRVASSLYSKGIEGATTLQKNRLCKIFFALYSFDNLGFGYDSIQDVISVSDHMKQHADIAKKHWADVSALTSNETARSNLENRLFI